MEFINKIKQNYEQWARVTPQGLLYDRALFWLFVVLLLIGLVAVTSASMPYSARVFNDTFYFAKRDAVYVLLSLATCYLTLQISSSQWEKWHAKVFLLAIVLLILVLGIGTSVNGAKRWISLGILNFQPAEFAKLALTCFLASYFTRRYDEVRGKKFSAAKPFIVMGVLGIFLLAQPDLGSTVVLFVITFGMLFIVGANFWQFILLIGTGILLFVWLVLSASYRLKRFTGFLEPFKDPYGTGFQLTNSLMAFGRDGKQLAALSSQSHLFETMEQAISFLRARLKSGDMVLLSPACASLDQFVSFEKRGEEFTRLAKLA